MTIAQKRLPVEVLIWLRFFVLSTSFEPVVADLLTRTDDRIAAWFHSHLSQPLIRFMLCFSGLGSPFWVAALTISMALFLIYKRNWYDLFALFLIVPGGNLLNEMVKVLVHRDRPFHESQFVDLSGYSFPSGHTMAATLVYFLLLIFVLPAVPAWRWRLLLTILVVVVVATVGLSRVALGAHYLTDVVAAVFGGVLWVWLCLTVVRRMRSVRVSQRSGPVR